MAYSSEIRVGTSSGSPMTVNVSLSLWELSSTIDGAGGVHHNQVSQDDVSLQGVGAAPAGFAFVRGPDFLANNNHAISLAAYEVGRPGPIFRSGRVETLPPGAPGDPHGRVDVMILPSQRFTMADINAMIPTPITLPDGNVVDAVTVSSAFPSKTLTLVATGPYGATSFTYTLAFTIDPSNDQFDDHSVLTATPVGRGSLVFTAGSGGGLQAFVDNLFAGLFTAKITTDVLAEMTRQLNAAAAAAGASAAAASGFSELPPDIYLGVRTVTVASNGDLVMLPVIGTWWSIIDKFSAVAPPAKCFLATAAVGSDSIEVSTLRAFRDERLLTTWPGRLAVSVYEHVSPPLARLIAAKPMLRAIVRKLVVAPAYAIATLSECGAKRRF